MIGFNGFYIIRQVEVIAIPEEAFQFIRVAFYCSIGFTLYFARQQEFIYCLFYAYVRHWDYSPSRLIACEYSLLSKKFDRGVGLNFGSMYSIFSLKNT
jgi:hypothetical protein